MTGRRRPRGRRASVRRVFAPLGVLALALGVALAAAVLYAALVVAGVLPGIEP